MRKGDRKLPDGMTMEMGARVSAWARQAYPRDTAKLLWRLSHRFDPAAVAIADRHYSRQKPGTPQFMPPGRCLVLLADTADGRALWGSSWPLAKYTQHAWAGAWICSLFRNEGAALSSEMIRQAVAATRAHFGEPPQLGIVTFVQPAAIRSTNPGYCFLKAGWRRVGKTKGGLPVLQQPPHEMPPPAVAVGAQSDLLRAA